MFKSLLSRSALVLGMLALAFVVSVEPAFAQANPINFGSAQSQLQSTITPLIGLIKIILAVLAVLYGMFEAFKASRGDAKGWFKALGLFIVAALVTAPTFILRTFGMTALASELQAWGF